MVIRTFCQPGSNESIDAQRLTSSSAPFVFQGQRVRWQAEIPYGCPHLSSTKANEFDDIKMMLVVRFWLFSNFLQVFTLVLRRHSSPMTHEILLCWAGTTKFDSMWKRRGYPILLLSRHRIFVDASDVVSFLSEWQVPLVGILVGLMMFRSNKISVLSLLRFYLQ